MTKTFFIILALSILIPPSTMHGKTNTMSSNIESEQEQTSRNFANDVVNDVVNILWMCMSFTQVTAFPFHVEGTYAGTTSIELDQQLWSYNVYNSPTLMESP